MTTEPCNLDILISATKLNIQGKAQALAASRKRKADEEAEERWQGTLAQERWEQDCEDQERRMEEYHSQSLALL